DRLNSELLSRTPCRRDVTVGGAALCWLRDFDLEPRSELLGNEAGQIRDADRLLGADVVRRSGSPSEENSKEPDGHIRGVEVGPNRRAIPAYLDRASGERVANEISNGEVRVQRQVGADEREAASDDHIEAGGGAGGDSCLLGAKLGFPINGHTCRLSDEVFCKASD